MSESNTKDEKFDDKIQETAESTTDAVKNEPGVEEGTSTDSEGNVKSNSWFTEPVWATALLSTAKEKTKSTFETMKKDIHEFSDTLQHGANSLVNATAQQAQKIQHMIAPVPDPNEDAIGTKTEELNAAESKLDNAVEVQPSTEQTGEAVTEDSNKGGTTAGIFGMGWMKQVVETVHKFATEDTTKEENECTEEIRVGPGGRRTMLDQFTLLQMQNEPRTFLQPPQQNVDLYKDWLTDFKISEYNGEINILLGYNPRLREIYAELVPAQVDNNTFWNRYFFKVHLKELDRQIALGIAAPKGGNAEKIGSTGHSPAPSNGKDDWSMCSSGMTTEAEDLENGDGDTNRDDASTPRPQKLKADEEVDDWEECEGEEDVETAGKEGKNLATAK